jgi:hypothetical protein
MSEFADFDLCGPLYYGSKVNCVPYIAVLVLICLFSVEEKYTHSCSKYYVMCIIHLTRSIESLRLNVRFNTSVRLVAGHCITILG